MTTFTSFFAYARLPPHSPASMGIDGRHTFLREERKGDHFNFIHKLLTKSQTFF
jgi:hypothetical protein